MAKFRILALFAFLVSSAQLSAGSILSVDGGVYSRVTARIDADAVPRQHCKRAIKNLQVSSPTCPASIRLSNQPQNYILIRCFATLTCPALFVGLGIKFKCKSHVQCPLFCTFLTAHHQMLLM